MSINTHLDHIAAHRTLITVQRIIDRFLPTLGYERIDVPAVAPTLIPESYLEVFRTEYRWMSKKRDLFLSPSPELYLKRLIAEGLGSCFSLMKCYRNGEPPSDRHSGEFTMLELYKVNGDYMQVADDILLLFRELARELYGSSQIEYQGTPVSFERYEKITVAQAFQRYAGIDSVFNEGEFLRKAADKGYTVDGFTYTDVWSQVYAQEVEPFLGKNGCPTLLYEYPRPLAATAEFDESTGVARRLELYVNGLELGNCGNASTADMNFAELRQRFQNEQQQRKERGMVEHPADMEFIEVLSRMPRTAGIAIGVERLAMVFANAASLQELKVVSFDL